MYLKKRLENTSLCETGTSKFWINRLEVSGIVSGYGLGGLGPETLSRAIEQREQVRQYCVAVRDSLLSSQKADESFDFSPKHYLQPSAIAQPHQD